MDLIVVQPVGKLKNIGQVVKVKKGYARNFLLPRGYALVATANNKQKFEEIKVELALKQEKESTLAASKIANLEGKVLTFLEQALEDGKLFGSVRSKTIAAALEKEYDIKLRSDQVELSEAITKIGVYKVKVSLAHGLVADVLVNVARNDIEASSQLTAYHAEQAAPATVEKSPESSQETPKE
ncbi:Putative 50S ribosomal protein L9 [Candidatus Phycorickettsia trachydisci]|uniref:Large ribosomal subunit protein bL9 n=1 Tax=Candidatus Phycorickettsia trachydisci TaxID=2115978 RepID=A0A2P1PA31_9RICK|nr:50S ribosomal protein L9 [Candidatus Phycorickettsia trachydisci]AVP88120.1 Putative 50S ribosomal protein L9 [Candidatus Phycorickettsia trachydisci]